MSDLPEPLTPADCDLRDFGFMPLDCARLLDSSLFARSTGDEFKAAVALWCKAWGQVPAGSLPDDNRDLVHLSGAGARWNKVKAMALHGWVKCSDGRLYHPVVAEKAMEGWAKKLLQRARGRKGNEVRWGSRRDAEGMSESVAQGSPEDRQGIAKGSQGESLKDRKGQGQGQGQGDERNPLTPTADAVGEQVSISSTFKPPIRGSRAAGTSPRQVASAEAANRPPPPEPDSPLWPVFRARGMTPFDFGKWVAPLVRADGIDGRVVLVAPSAFHADRVRAEYGPTLALALGGPVDVRAVMAEAG